MGSMNSSTRISPTVAGLRFVISMARLTGSCGRRGTRGWLLRDHHPSERQAAISDSRGSSDTLSACPSASRDDCRLIQDFEHGADSYEPSAFLNAPCPSRNEYFIQAGARPERDFAFNHFAGMQ